MYVDIHTHRRRCDRAVEVLSLAATVGRRGVYPAPPFSIGVHPWQVAGAGTLRGGSSAGVVRDFVVSEAARGSHQACEAMLREVKTAPASAIGEIGLDYAVAEASRAFDSAGRDLQREVFEAQLMIASRRGLPVVLHCVRAFEETMRVLAGFPELPAVIFHGFVGSPEQARRAVGKGYFLSFGVRSLASPRTVEVMRSVPLEKMFLETDEADVSIEDVYARAAELLGVPVWQLEDRIYDNYQRIFGAH